MTRVLKRTSVCGVLEGGLCWMAWNVRVRGAGTCG